jgi:predicted nucleotidyltransferase
MHSLIYQKRADISRICRRLHIQKLEVFGSAARGSDFDPEQSDADFLVEFAPGAKHGLDGYFALKSELEQLLGRGVDLVEPRSVRNPYVLAGINSSRELVYAA